MFGKKRLSNVLLLCIFRFVLRGAISFCSSFFMFHFCTFPLQNGTTQHEKNGCSFPSFTRTKISTLSTIILFGALHFAEKWRTLCLKFFGYTFGTKIGVKMFIWLNFKRFFFLKWRGLRQNLVQEANLYSFSKISSSHICQNQHHWKRCHIFTLQLR